MRIESASKLPLPGLLPWSDRTGTNSSRRGRSSAGDAADRVPRCVAQICRPVGALTAFAVAPSSMKYSVCPSITGGNSISALPPNRQPRRNGGCRLAAPVKSRVRAALKPYSGQTKRSTTTGLRAGVVTVTAGVVVVVGVVNERSGCETLPGLCASTTATTPPTMINSTTATVSRRCIAFPGGRIHRLMASVHEPAARVPRPTPRSQTVPRFAGQRISQGIAPRGDPPRQRISTGIAPRGDSVAQARRSRAWEPASTR